MKLVKNELFIEKNWVKIAVGISFYCWKTKLVVGSKFGWNLIMGSSHSRWGSILVVGSHPTSIWTIRCTWNWPLELGQNLDHRINVGKLGAVGLAAGARRRFFQKIGEINWNKRKFLQNFPIGGKFFQKITDISLFTEIYGYFFRRHFTPLFRFADPRNTKFRWNFNKKNRHFQPWIELTPALLIDYGLLYQLIFSHLDQTNGFGRKLVVCVLNAFIRDFKSVELIIESKPPKWSNDEGAYLAQHLILLKVNHRKHQLFGT